MIGWKDLKIDIPSQGKKILYFLVYDGFGAHLKGVALFLND